LLRRALELGLAAGLARQPDRFSVCSKRDAGCEMTEETGTVTDFAAELRGKLVDELREWEPFRVATVENAMRTVPRHVFLPGVPVEEAYSHGNVITHRDSEGVTVSSASAAGTVAGMLQQLEVRPGHRVLEIGAGTGYNAALLTHLVAPGGK
jgi:protein-L-isoaspartate(D-aspartate) O-methyltransferase